MWGLWDRFSDTHTHTHTLISILHKVIMVLLRDGKKGKEVAAPNKKERAQSGGGRSRSRSS